MAYDRAFRQMVVPYTFLLANSDINRGFVGPKGIKGRVIDYGCYGVSTTFAGGTTTPTLSVGVAASHASIGAAFDFGLLATTDGGKSVLSTYNKQTNIDTYILNRGDLAADTAYFAYCTAATGGGAAGAATMFVLVGWGL